MSALRWWRIRVEFQSLKPFLSAPNIGAVEAIAKGVTDSLGWLDPDGSDHDHPCVFYHLVRWSPCRNPTHVEVDVFLSRTDRADAWRWTAAFRAFMADPSHCITYALDDCAMPEERSLEILRAESGEWPLEGELCLRFDTPYSFPRPEGSSRTFLSHETFVQAFERRFSRLFGLDLRYSSHEDDFRLLPWFWHYSERRRFSKSQPGTLQYVKGCAGPLYLKGRFADFLPWLLLGSELHCGSKLANAQGHYRLQQEAPFFLRRFPQKTIVRKVAGEVVEASEADALAERLYASLADGSWRPTSVREERLAVEDLAVHKLLRRLFAPVVAKMLKDETIVEKSERSGHETGAVRKNLGSGGGYESESDSCEFFSSVNLARLFGFLDDGFPIADRKILELLKTCLQHGNGNDHPPHDRQVGWPQESPLAPLLASLVRHVFPGEFMEEAVMYLIRYEISSGNERRKVENCLKNHGFCERHGGFEGRLFRNDKIRMMRELEGLGIESGQVEIYRLERSLSAAKRKVRDAGGPPIDDEPAIIV